MERKNERKKPRREGKRKFGMVRKGEIREERKKIGELVGTNGGNGGK